ncbi:Aminoglycoside phosphotransferase [Penicillium psychrosexuale]|uniref:Aminoglycoside phosphotransferase n=1 Tax=Penicillium psychrosexuale TaxID=1002107 RepID=UPI00254538ED|nr:Aminoglycoside phosphotransferase [Penicillium psychrosexuale]KAJ5803802.1 Aminoglycoside phosphotransferase [Penicillium psychrosexuale]
MDFNSRGLLEDLTQIERKDVVSKVAAIINNLHLIPLPKEQEPSKAAQPVSYAGAGPFSSTEQLQAWFNRRLEITQQLHRAPPDATPFVFNKLTLTHYDIAPRNLILDSEGKVWLIDWGDAGIYPEGLEFAALNTRRDESSELTEMLSEMIPRCEELSHQMLLIAFALTTGQWIDSRLF